MKYLLSLDIGAFSVKALLLNEAGALSGFAQKALAPAYPFHDRIELDPEEIFQTVLFVMKQAIQEAEIKKTDICGLGISNARGCAIVWDKQTKLPLWNAILKNDNRTTSFCINNKQHDETIHKKTGVPLSPYGAATKIRWILDNAPNVNVDDCLFGGINSWILWRLTKGEVFATDMTNASKTLLFNIHEKKWDDELIDIFGLKQSMLPDIVSCNEVYGHLHEEYLGVKIPICSMISDASSAMFASGCNNEGDMHFLAGTSSFLLMNTGSTPKLSSNHLMTTIGLSMDGEGETYCLEGSVTSTGSVIEWFESHLGIIRSAKEVEGLAYSVPDSGGVYFIPAISGISAPFNTEKVRGSLLGLSPSTNIGHICRAALEGIAFLVRDIFERFKELKLNPEAKIKCSGGMTENVFLLQITSDLMGKTLVRSRDIKLSAYGPAYLAGITLGIWKDKEAVRSLFKTDREFKPELSQKDKQIMLMDWKKAMASAMLFSDIKIA